MAALHSAADIYLTASRWEGFDLPLAEAAAQGVPSVALRIGAHPEVVRDGETGILVDNVTELIEEAQRLARDPALRRTMGAAARAWAGNFTWSRASDAYEEMIKELAPAAARVGVSAGATGGVPAAAQPVTALAEGEARPEPDVTAVILNYGAEYPVLQKCVGALVTQTYPLKTILVDNGSAKNQDAVTQAKLEFPEIEVLQLDKNYGFAGGINRGVDKVISRYVLLVNNDAVLAPDAAAKMRALIEGREDVAGIAPKILLDEPPGYIDAIGNLVDPMGQAFNMGIGQLDIGQYDRVEETFGACFAATLLRRETWREGLVGPLDERYFMYYEDVDWCFRAGVLGYKFLTCPTAVVQHAHSLSTRQLNYGYKYRMIMRNFVRTVIKDFQGRSWMRIAAKRCLGLTRNVIRGPQRGASLLALKDIAFSFPTYYGKRRAIQGRRKVTDWSLFNYSHGEQVFFDPTGYAPVRRLETLAFMYNRMYLLYGEPRYREIAATASALAGSRIRFDRDFARAHLRPLVEGEPEKVRRYVEGLEV
jgi:GT2 family glycosyltransferase